jgi:hypothetical protein
MTFLDGTCQFCHRSYRTVQCSRSDHYRTCLDLAWDAAEKAFVSYACQHPDQQQAPISPAQQGRRHPYEDVRPEYSGYCVIDGCACPCHRNEVRDEIQLEEVGADG